MARRYRHTTFMSWKFVIAVVDLLYDHSHDNGRTWKTCLEQSTLLSTSVTYSRSQTPAIETVAMNGTRLAAILCDFTSIISSFSEDHTTGIALYLPRDNLKDAKQEFQHILKQSICRLSISHWASPLCMLRKKESSYRSYDDYRRFNAITIQRRLSGLGTQ